MIQLHTADEVVDALGGTRVVAELFGRTDPAVSNWRKAGKFPAHTYRLLTIELEKIGHTAPDSLWSMTVERANA